MKRDDVSIEWKQNNKKHIFWKISLAKAYHSSIFTMLLFHMKRHSFRWSFRKKNLRKIQRQTITKSKINWIENWDDSGNSPAYWTTEFSGEIAIFSPFFPLYLYLFHSLLMHIHTHVAYFFFWSHLNWSNLYESMISCDLCHFDDVFFLLSFFLALLSWPLHFYILPFSLWHYTFFCPLIRPRSIRPSTLFLPMFVYTNIRPCMLIADHHVFASIVMGIRINRSGSH